MTVHDINIDLLLSSYLITKNMLKILTCVFIEFLSPPLQFVTSDILYIVTTTPIIMNYHADS